MNSKILISILAIALVSGCISEIPGLPAGGALGGGAGLEITSFTAEPTTVFSGSSVRLIMETTNQGGTTVPNSDSLVYLTGSNVDVWGLAGNYFHFEKDMKAEDVVRGIPADTKRFSWTLTAPSITAGQTRSDTFIGRIYHEYKTSANGNVWVYSETEAEAARTGGRSLYTPSFTYTKGPVGLTVSITPTPVILYGTENSFSMNIKINNLATGTIYHPNAVTYASGSEDVALAAAELNNVTVTVSGTGLTVGNDCIGDKELVAGRETTLVCDVTVDTVPATFKSYAVDITVSYGYYTERTASVTIQGK